jgi:hypothetical protein
VLGGGGGEHSKGVGHPIGVESSRVAISVYSPVLSLGIPRIRVSVLGALLYLSRYLSRSLPPWGDSRLTIAR